MISTAAFSEGDAQQTGLGGNLRPIADVWHQIIYYQVNYLLIMLFCEYLSDGSGGITRYVGNAISFNWYRAICMGNSD
jgi:hypothetical protein